MRGQALLVIVYDKANKRYIRKRTTNPGAAWHGFAVAPTWVRVGGQAAAALAKCFAQPWGVS